VPDRAQIIEPKKPDRASVSPNTQKTRAAWNVFKEKFIKRKQQSDMQRPIAFLGTAAPTETHGPPTNQPDRVACGILSMVVYTQCAVNDNHG